MSLRWLDAGVSPSSLPGEVRDFGLLEKSASVHPGSLLVIVRGAARVHDRGHSITR